MTPQPDPTALTEATQAARTALSAFGADVARVTSRAVTGGGYPDGTILTEVRLQPHSDTGRIIDALRGLPCLVDLWSADGSIVVLHSPGPTNFGPGGRDGLTTREAVRQSQLIHPDWSPAMHVDWLIEDGYHLHHMDRATVQAVVADWLAAKPQVPHHLFAASDKPADAATASASADGDTAGQLGVAGERAQVNRPGTGDDRLDSPGVPALPPGGRLLSADDAVDLLVIGHHADSRHGSLVLDAALIEAIRNGQVVACLLANGQIAFTRAIQDTHGPGQPSDTDESAQPPEA
jgi:hypothetical protein